MTFVPLIRTNDHPDANAGIILPLMIGYISSYLGWWLFHIVLSSKKLLVRTAAAWSTCSSLNSAMYVYDCMEMIMLSSSLWCHLYTTIPVSIVFPILINKKHQNKNKTMKPEFLLWFFFLCFETKYIILLRRLQSWINIEEGEGSEFFKQGNNVV